MIYEPNKEHWRRGDLVIHWCDAKEPKMLMKIIGFTRDSLVKTQYLFRSHKRTIYINGMENLLDPSDFNLSVRVGDWDQKPLQNYQHEFEQVRFWNHVHPEIGVWVKKISADGQDIPVTRTKSKAFMQGHQSRISLEHGGIWALRFVVAVPDPDEKSAQAEFSSGGRDENGLAS